MDRAVWWSLALAVCVGGRAYGGSVSVLESTRDHLTFTWQLSSFDTTAVGTSKGVFTHLSVQGANTDLGGSGRPIVPAFSFHVGVPPGGSASVTVEPVEVVTVKLSHPVVRRDMNGKAARVHELPFSQAWVSNAVATPIGRLSAVGWALRPFLLDEGSGTMRVLKQARVTVRYTGATTAHGVASTTNYDPVLKRLLLNYEIARTWVAPRPTTSLRKAAQSAFPLSGQVAEFRIGDGHDSLNEGTTNENGLVRISGSAVIAALGSGLAISRVQLWASQMGELPWGQPDSSGPPLHLVQIPLLRYDVGHDGVVGPNDCLVAFVSGASDWCWNASTQSYRFQLNRFDDYRGYWLTYGSGQSALTMGRFDTSSLHASGDVSQFHEHVYHKRSQVMLQDGREGTYDWVWEHLTSVANTYSYTASLPDVNPDSIGQVRVFLGASGGGAGLGLQFGSRQLSPLCINQVQYPITNWASQQVQMNYNGPVDKTSFAELEHLEYDYVRPIDLTGKTHLSVFSPSTPGVVRYHLSGVPTGQRVSILRIPADETQTSLIDTVTLSSGTYTWVDSAGIGVRYHLSTDAGFQPAPAIQVYQSANSGTHALTNLHQGASCDFLIVSPDDQGFLDQAERLAVHKESIGRFHAVRVVDMADVYREFSGGVADPAALRNVLTYAKRYWPDGDKLNYVILMGLGNYDMKHVSSQEPVQIPVAEIGAGLSTQWCVESFFSGDSATIFLGRLPCLTEAEAKAMVDKIVATEEIGTADFGAWRNRLILVADNDRQGSTLDGTGHWISSEDVYYDVAALRPSLDIRKIYLYEYQFNAQWEMPDAAQALRNEINAGAGCINYFGHGGYDVWADERILTISDIPSLTNLNHYPIVVSLSCEVGKFDVPDQNCLSDMLVRAAGAGAIASIAATRDAYAGSNTDFGGSMYQVLYDTVAPMSIGQAYALARLEQMRDSGELQPYAILGDPSILLVDPTHRVVMQVKDLATGRVVDTLKALQRLLISGTVQLAGSHTRDGSYGTAAKPASIQLGLYNPGDTATRKDGLPDATSTPVFYFLPGSPVFIGRTQVVGGAFQQSILVPRSVTFDKHGARLIAYAWDDTLAGLGYDTSIVFHGTDTSAANRTDTSGPTIAIQLVNADGTASTASFTDGFSGILPVRFNIVVCDPNGIDVTGTGPAEGLTIEIPGVISKRSINSTFQFKQGDYRQGSAPFDIYEGQVQPGQYRMSITARDLLQNISTLSVQLQILPPTALSLDHVFNYPNPMRMGATTRFYFNLPSSPWVVPATKVVLRIYTLSGKLLRVVQDPENGYEWDGRDQFGNLLSPNVYLYRVVAESRSGTGQQVQSPIRKLVIHPPK